MKTVSIKNLAIVYSKGNAYRIFSIYKNEPNNLLSKKQRYNVE